MENLVVSFWKGKKVFLTGHTGFKGSWMALELLNSGANLTGYSLGLPTNPSLFEDLKIEKDMHSIFGDIRNLDNLKGSMIGSKPEIVIHMAAQPLVRQSYHDPVETYSTNVMGTVNVFESVRACSQVKAVLNVTSDKCYENQEREQGYAENEPMGGYDPYSNSKGCSELVTAAYRNSFFVKSGVHLASARSGNVIGGGDWSDDRLIPDIVRSVIKGEELVIRSPNSTRPWQHVLEPVCGYLLLAEKLFSSGEKFAQGYNFGPSEKEVCSVENIIRKMNKVWSGKIRYKIELSAQNPHEAKLLSLNCEKARKELGWEPHWNIDTALDKTVEWYQSRIESQNVRERTLKQISEFRIDVGNGDE